MTGTKRERAGIRGTCVAGNEMRITLKCFVESVSVDACTDERCGDVPDFVHDSVLFFHGSLAGTPRAPAQACLAHRRSHLFSSSVFFNLGHTDPCDNLCLPR